MKTGDKVKIKEEHQQLISELDERCTASTFGVHMAIEAAHERSKRLWNALEDLYPEIVGHFMSYNEESKEITIKSNKVSKEE